MKRLIHARLGETDRAILEDLKRATGWSDSEVIRRGLRLVRQDLGRSPSALDAAGRSVGRFRGGPRDLSTNPVHMDEFGR
jgi:hypothetical protein